MNEVEHKAILSRAKLVLIVVCLIAIPVTFWVNHSDVGSVNERVTRVESPCLRYGAKSKQCKEAFEQAVLTITHAQACAILRKAGLEIEPCAHARLRQEKRRGRERAATDRMQAQGGDASQTGSTGHQQHTPSSKGGGGGHGKGGAGKGGGEGPSAPGQGGSGGGPAPPDRGSGNEQSHGNPAPPASEAAKSQQPTLPATVEATGKAAGEAVEKTGEAVQGTVQGASGAVCGTVAAPGCSK